MDVGAEAFVRRRPEVPALLSELGLSGRQRATTGARPLLYSQRGAASAAVGHGGRDSVVGGVVWPGWSTTPRSRGSTPNRADRCAGDPAVIRAVAELVADRFGQQVVARSVDPLLGGVYAGSAATIGLRAGAPSVAAALDRGAASLTDAVRQGLPPAGGGPVFGALDGGYEVLVDELASAAGCAGCEPASTAPGAAPLGAAR